MTTASISFQRLYSFPYFYYRYKFIQLIDVYDIICIVQIFINIFIFLIYIS